MKIVPIFINSTACK